jgi:hypothetical protein
MYEAHETLRGQFDRRREPMRIARCRARDEENSLVMMLRRPRGPAL